MSLRYLHFLGRVRLEDGQDPKILEEKVAEFCDELVCTEVRRNPPAEHEDFVRMKVDVVESHYPDPGVFMYFMCWFGVDDDSWVPSPELSASVTEEL